MDSPAQPQNNTQQIVPQNLQPSAVNDSSVQPKEVTINQTELPQDNLQPKSQITPVSGPSKESAPIAVQAVNQESSIVQPSEQEPVLSPEVKDLGVSVIPDQEKVSLSPEVSAAGVEAVKTAVPVQTTASNNIQLPMTEEEAKKAIKTHPAVDAAFGFGTEVLKQLKRLHRGLFKQNTS